MRKWRWVMAALALAATACGRQAEPSTEPPKPRVPFFNGQDLTGWRGLRNCWSVKDGAIVGASPSGSRFNTFLCSENTYRDFELHFHVKLTGTGWNGNSGVNIRSRIDDKKKLTVHGPSCDMGQSYWGSLVGGEGMDDMLKEADRQLVKSVLKPRDFNDYYIKCLGKHVIIKLNGTTTVDDDIEEMAADGIIAWQLHAGPPMEVIFKDIQFREID
jgi:hypothetical protein